MPWTVSIPRYTGTTPDADHAPWACIAGLALRFQHFSVVSDCVPGQGFLIMFGAVLLLVDGVGFVSGRAAGGGALH